MDIVWVLDTLSVAIGGALEGIDAEDALSAGGETDGSWHVAFGIERRQ